MENQGKNQRIMEIMLMNGGLRIGNKIHIQNFNNLNKDKLISSFSLKAK